MGRVATLEKEGVMPMDLVSGEESETKVEAVEGPNMYLAQMMSCYKKEE